MRFLSSSETRTTAAIITTAAAAITVLNFLPTDNQIGLIPANPGRVPHAEEEDNFRTKCESFITPEHLSLLDPYGGNAAASATRNIVAFIPAGTEISLVPDNDLSCGRTGQVVSVDTCRVALHIPTSRRSGITFELWLPRETEWVANRRRFLGTGNGGVDGCIKYEDLAYGVAHGFATMGTNNGHNGTTAASFYQNDDVAVDFAWRALHTGVLAGKVLATQFYSNTAPRKSYYIGCSLGGRQGINAATQFPSDFDGVIAGAPALDFNHLVSWRARFFTLTRPRGSSDFIPAETWSGLIHDEVLRQCDGLDGVVDGIIEDPQACRFRAEDLLCRDDEGEERTSGRREAACLTPRQMTIVNTIFSPFRADDGDLIYPAMQPGSELGAVQRLYAGIPFPYSESWFRYVVYNPTWDPSTFNVQDAVVAETLNPGNIKTWPDRNDLSAFRARGGKLITYHGQQDQQITSFNTARWYQHLLLSDPPRTTTEEDLDAFLRVFRISGMFHCAAGPGAWVIGQGGDERMYAGVPFERSHNVLAAIVAWVEDEAPPETMTGTKFVEDDHTKGTAFERRHCRYPWINTYIGDDSSNPDSWECRITS